MDESVAILPEEVALAFFARHQSGPVVVPIVSLLDILECTRAEVQSVKASHDLLSFVGIVAKEAVCLRRKTQVSSRIRRNASD